jgi:hypothetical protein
MNGLIGLANYFDKAGFLLDVAKKQTLTVYFDGKFVTRLPLPPSYAAVQSLMQCQNKIDEITASSAPSGRPSDPFANGRVPSSGPSDPFANDTVPPASDPFNRWH